MLNAAAVEAFSDPAVRQRRADLCQEILPREQQRRSPATTRPELDK
jgi:predicted nucleic acid-binding Zn ribbon protein